MMTVIGMGTVFLALAVLALVIKGLDALVLRWEDRGIPSSKEQAVRPAAGREEDPGGEDWIPVIAAAIGAYLEAESAQVFLVPVERPGRSAWVMEGRVAALSGGEARPGGNRF
jgi:sodium pump decarboxylase gamma subunit